MRRIDIAENFATAARQAQQLGDHRRAAALFAQALKAIVKAPGRIFWDTRKWQEPPAIDDEEAARDTDGVLREPYSSRQE